MIPVTEENLPEREDPDDLGYWSRRALGSLIAERLAGRDDTVLGTRDAQQLQTPLPVRHIDFDDPGTLVTGFEGVDVLLLISAGYGEDDTVITRHGAAVDAAEKAGVGHVVYTSLTADGDHLSYALPHRWTEHRLQKSSLGWTILRNGLYAELLAGLAAPSADGRITALLGEAYWQPLPGRTWLTPRYVWRWRPRSCAAHLRTCRRAGYRRRRTGPRSRSARHL
ncbi:NAD(P)H-binding protein [Streptomyces stramineus]